MSNTKNRRKRDCKVLSRQELYEKYIPHISQDFAKIIDKSKNSEFKQRCQHLLKVDDPSKVKEAISSQLFKLTLGNQSNINISQKKLDQESRDQRSSSVNQADIQSCFGDLADHIDDDPWPALDEHSSLIARSEVNDLSSQCSRTNPKINTPETCSKIQDTATAIDDSTSSKNYKLTDMSGDGNSDDENFNSLELHAMLDETAWEDTATCCPGNQMVQHFGTRKQGTAPTESDDSHFETLGNLF